MIMGISLCAYSLPGESWRCTGWLQSAMPAAIHVNGNPTDNRSTNLRWCTFKTEVLTHSLRSRRRFPKLAACSRPGDDEAGRGSSVGCEPISGIIPSITRNTSSAVGIVTTHGLTRFRSLESLFRVFSGHLPLAIPDPLPWAAIAGALAAAEDSLARLDERLAKSKIREGWVSRSNFTDAAVATCAQGSTTSFKLLRASAFSPAHDQGAF